MVNVKFSSKVVVLRDELFSFFVVILVYFMLEIVFVFVDFNILLE